MAVNAKNIHKPIRDNLICVMALYQQLRELRDAIAKNPSKQRKREESLSKLVDSKRLLLSSPKQEIHPKRQKITDTSPTLDTNDNQNETGENNWKKFRNRKRTKKKEIANRKETLPKITGEALTIKTSDTKTYAEMLKQMKSKINPTEYGVEIREVRRTKAGELQKNLKKF